MSTFDWIFGWVATICFFIILCYGSYYFGVLMARLLHDGSIKK